MKKNRLNTAIATIFCFIALSSCSKVEEITQKDVVITPNSVTFTIPEVTSTDAGSISAPFEVNLDLAALIKEKASSFGVGNIKSIKITSLKIDLINGDDANNFKIIENLSASISAEGLSSKVLASVTNNDFTTVKQSLVIPVTGGDIELKDYLKATSFKYSISGKAHSKTTKALQAKLTASYTFKLGL